MREGLRSGKRYRGFLEVSGNFLPVTFNLYTLNERSVRIRYLFPTSLSKHLSEGKVLYILVEEGRKNLIAEARVVKVEERGAVLSVDFITEDRRKLPRIKIKGAVKVEAVVRCSGREVKGEVEDISLSSVSVSTDGEVWGGECDLTLIHGGRRYGLKARFIRSEGKVSVFEVSSGSNALTELLGRVFTEMFLKFQRES